MRGMSVGQIMLAVGLIGFGALSLIYDDFGMNWQVVPPSLPARGALAYAAGAFEIAAGAALLLKASSVPAALALTVYSLLWVALLDYLPLLSKLSNVGAWSAAGERTLLFAGVWALYATLAREQRRLEIGLLTDDRARLVSRILFGLAIIPIGLSHLAYPEAVSFVPAWLPFRPFWLEFTGACHIAAGVALVLGIVPRLAATLEAVMMSSFVLLVHVPRVAGAPHVRFEWTMLFIAITFTGAAWAMARAQRDAAWVPLRAKTATA
jgi:uncharacterized membrane protein